MILNRGQAVTLTVTAEGTAPFTYQWYRDGVAIEGASGATLAIPQLSYADAGSYTAQVSNSVGSTMSDSGSITVRSEVTDFDVNGSPDLLLENTTTGQRKLWLMGGTDNTTVSQSLDLGFLDIAWHMVGVADFNKDEAPDVLLENVLTGQRVLWLMGGANNAIVTQAYDLGFLDPAWHMAGIADFNCDGAPDILLQNIISGQRVLWLMGGPNNAFVIQAYDLGVLDAIWSIVALADFNGDGAPDVVLENTVNGQRVLWLMGGPNNAYVLQGLDLGLLDPTWHIAKATDFNSDGSPDILLENTITGQRVLWLMGGPNNAFVTKGIDLGITDVAWAIAR